MKTTDCLQNLGFCWRKLNRVFFKRFNLKIGFDNDLIIFITSFGEFWVLSIQRKFSWNWFRWNRVSSLSFLWINFYF